MIGFRPAHYLLMASYLLCRSRLRLRGEADQLLASTIYCRFILTTFLPSTRSLRAGELRYACTCSRLSHSLIPTRLGASPTLATILPLVPKLRPPAAFCTAEIAAVYEARSAESRISLSVTRYAFGLAWACSPCTAAAPNAAAATTAST